jgi:hypothetical protein
MMTKKVMEINGKERKYTAFQFEQEDLEKLEKLLSFEDAMDDDDDAFEEFMDWSSDSSYIGDAITEIADGRVDIYNSDLWKNAPNVQEYIEEALSEGLCDLSSQNTDLTRIFSTGEYVYYERALYDNLDNLCANYIIRKLKDINISYFYNGDEELTDEEIKEMLLDAIDNWLDDYRGDNNNRFWDLEADRDVMLEEIFSDMMSDHEGLVIAVEDDFEDALQEYIDENEDEDEED